MRDTTYQISLNTLLQRGGRDGLAGAFRWTSFFYFLAFATARMGHSHAWKSEQQVTDSCGVEVLRSILSSELTVCHVIPVCHLSSVVACHLLMLALSCSRRRTSSFPPRRKTCQNIWPLKREFKGTEKEKKKGSRLLSVSRFSVLGGSRTIRLGQL